MFLKILETKKEISTEQYKDSSPIYGSAKVDKIITGDLATVIYILSAIGTPTYKLAKFAMLELLKTNEYPFKDSFTFAELQSFDSKLVITNFDIESLLTNIPLQETTDPCRKFI